MDKGNKPNLPKRDEAWWQPAMSMFVKLSGWIVIPILIGVILGKWLDKKYDTEPWLFLASIGFAFLISIFNLVKNTAEEFKKISKSDKENQKKK